MVGGGGYVFVGRPVRRGWWYVLALGVVLIVRSPGSLCVYGGVWRVDFCGP